MKKIWLMSGLVVLSLLLLACGNNDESTAGTKSGSGSGSSIASLGDADLDAFLKANAGKPTLMIFWATWCPSCKQALPEMEGLAMSHGEKANVVAVSLDEDPAALVSYLEKNPLQMPVFLGDQKLAARFAIEAIPTLVIFDKTGKQVFAKAGAFPLGMLQKVVDDLTAG
jgi:thiol-disulfide isomerase/thioredoxin